MLGLSYGALRACQLRGFRNGSWRHLTGVQKGFYRACMAYAKLREVIVNRKLLGFLRELLDKLGSTVRARALKLGLEEAERVTPIYLRAGVFRWARRLHSWLKEEPYLLWLGFMKLNAPPC